MERIFRRTKNHFGIMHYSGNTKMWTYSILRIGRGWCCFGSFLREQACWHYRLRKRVLPILYHIIQEVDVKLPIKYCQLLLGQECEQNQQHYKSGEIWGGKLYWRNSLMSWSKELIKWCMFPFHFHFVSSNYSRTFFF